MTARVVVLGGDGMLGSMVVRLLAESPELEVIATTRSPDRSGANLFKFDIEDGANGLAALESRFEKIDFFVNCIGFLAGAIDINESESVQQAINVNALFPYQLDQAAKKQHARVISISTDGVFAPESGTCKESKRPDGQDLYGRTKHLGEVLSSRVLNLRCSIIGPSPFLKKGIFEWVLSQKKSATVVGYSNQLWNGVTTLQFARLVSALITDRAFDKVRDEAPVHHFCPNRAVTKFQLVDMIARKFRTDITVREEQSAQSVSRILDSEYRSLTELSGSSLELGDELDKLKSHCNPI